jgi:7-carboxy-7-deazaguanine synthase
VAETLLVHEIYLSVQGESTFAGLPCIFVRLTGCNLRCSYCDTAYAFSGGESRTRTQILEEVGRLAARFVPAGEAGRLPLVELTGGEPLLQRGTLPLMTALADAGFTVLIETSGALDIADVDVRVRRIVDVKCPSSGEAARNRPENLEVLRPTDELKFVIATHEDYEFARDLVKARGLVARCPVLFSWAAPLLDHQRDPSLRAIPTGQRLLSRRELVERIVADCLPVRFQLQMHKFIWPPDARGV